MAKCSVCNKGVTFGHNVSHSNRKTNRTWKANIRRVKAVVNGTPKTVNVCSRCLRSGKVERAQFLAYSTVKKAVSMQRHSRRPFFTSRQSVSV